MSDTINIQSIIENKISLSKARTMAILHKGEIYSFFDEGTSRYCFSNPDETKVIKILKTTNGFDFNLEEFQIYQNASDDKKNQMVETNLFHGIIEQDFVTPIKFGGKKLTIAERLFAGQCRNEVGWTADGRLLCFDLDEYKKY